MLAEQIDSPNIVESLHPTQLSASEKRVQILVGFPRIGWIDKDLASEQTRISFDESLEFDSPVEVAELDTSEMKVLCPRKSRLGDLKRVPGCPGVVVLEDMGKAVCNISSTDDSNNHHFDFDSLP
jgi:hypothetical protein